MDSNEAPIRQFAQWLKADGRSEKTINAYVSDLKLLEKALANKPWLEVSRAELERAFSEPAIVLKKDGKERSLAGIKRVKCAARAFFSWATAIEIMDSNPASLIRAKGPTRKLPVFLSLKEKKVLLKTLRTRSTKVSFRDRVIIEVLLFTGIRVNELVNLNVDDLDLEEKRFVILGKGNREQVKFLKSRLRGLLKTYLKKHRPRIESEEALFLSTWRKRITGRQVENRVKHWVAEAGIKKNISPHKLRHTFATHLLSAEKNLKLVQRALGHASISSTEIYAHVVDEELEAALENL